MAWNKVFTQKLGLPLLRFQFHTDVKVLQRPAVNDLPQRNRRISGGECLWPAQELFIHTLAFPPPHKSITLPPINYLRSIGLTTCPEAGMHACILSLGWEGGERDSPACALRGAHCARFRMPAACRKTACLTTHEPSGTLVVRKKGVFKLPIHGSRRPSTNWWHRLARGRHNCISPC